MRERKILWAVTDPRGLSVSLAEDVWPDHVHKHPEIAAYFDEIKLTAQQPDEIYFDPLSSARRKPGTSIHLYHKRKLGRGKYKDTLIVVVVKSLEENSERQGFVESALLSDRIMNRLVLEWKQ
jgi:hypothetical protein